MALQALDYARPPRQLIQRRFMRASVGVAVYVLGWFCFSLYVWHLYGSIAVGREPTLRLYRNMCVPSVIGSTLLLTGMNIAYLIWSLISQRKPLALWCLYLSVALVPLSALALTEHLFGFFIVE
jgi:hypothetical protein